MPMRMFGRSRRTLVFAFRLLDDLGQLDHGLGLWLLSMSWIGDGHVGVWCLRLIAYPNIDNLIIAYLVRGPLMHKASSRTQF